MPNSKARSAARKHRKSKERWKAKHRESLTKIKVRTPKKKRTLYSPLTEASPSAVSNPSEGNPVRRTASMMLSDELRTGGSA